MTKGRIANPCLQALGYAIRGIINKKLGFVFGAKTLFLFIPKAFFK